MNLLTTVKKNKPFMKANYLQRVVFVIVNIMMINIYSAQTNPAHYTSELSSAQGSTNLIPGIIISGLNTGKTAGSLLNEKTTKASLILRLDLGEDYIVKNFLDASGHFNVKLKLKCSLGGTLEVIKDLEITQTSPEQIVAIDLQSAIQSGVLANTINIELVGAPIITYGAPLGFAQKYVEAKLQVTAFVDRYYGVDVRKTTNILAEPLICSPLNILNNRVIFNWSSPHSFSNYEVQIVRLFNETTATITDEHSITSTIDWSKALKVETQSFEKQIELSVMEGTGYYVWRVRPIGNYYEGGIGNFENYGNWSTTISGPTTVNSTTDASSNEFFFVNDADSDLNWIYSRTFTEGNADNSTGVRTSEGMSFADPLLRTRQSQAFNSENKTTIVSQSINDYSGRPTLTTVPVPISTPGGLEGYKVGFVKNNANDLYTAEDFDGVGTIDNPSEISQTGDFSYYNGSVSTGAVNNDGVASTEGYSFSRTIIKSDGTGRVTKSSGIGKKHALGTIADGKGRITRVLYASPSDDELIRIFGEEAPLAESVIKTISIDPNGVVSIAYTSKEGKTIATALVGSNVTNMSPLNNSAEMTIDNSTNQNVLSANVFESSKRLAFWEDEEVTLKYQVEQLATSCLDCGYRVQFYLVDIDKQITYVSDKDGFTGLTNQLSAFEAPANELVLDFSLTPNWCWVKSDNSAASTYVISGTEKNKFTLPAGEYLLIKKLFSINSGAAISSDLEADATVISEIMDVVTTKMQTAIDATTHTEVDTYLNELSGLFNQVGRDEVAIKTKLGLPDLGDIPDAFSITYTSNGVNEAGTLTISNGGSGDCAGCGSKSIGIPKPDVCGICEAKVGVDGFDGIGTLRESAITSADLAIDSPIWSSIQTILANGYSGTSAHLPMEGFLEYLHTNEVYLKIGKDALLNHYAAGFTEESLAFMLTNMLTSKYYTGQLKLNTGDGLYYCAKEDENGVLQFIKNAEGEFASGIEKYLPENLPGLKFNYDCKVLYQCWIQAVDMISAPEVGEDVNVMDAFNDQSETSSEDEADDPANSEDAEDKGVLDAIVGVVLHIKMRKFNDSEEGKVTKQKAEGMMNFPSLFMECAGYQFKDILDEDATIPDEYSTPNSIPSSTTFSTNLIMMPNSAIITQYGISSTPVLGSFGPNEDDPTIIEFTSEKMKCPECVNDDPGTDQLAYSYILKPEWMFKYFVYNSAEKFNGSGSFADDNRIIVNQYQLEIQNCYNDVFANCVNPTYPVCSGPTCNYFHKSWSAGQRLNFYQRISGGRKCPKACDDAPDAGMPTPVTPVNEPDYAAKKTMALNKLNDAMQICDNRKDEFKSYINEELNNACFEIVECTEAGSPPYMVSNSSVDLMAVKAVDACKAKIQVIIDDLNATSSTYYGTSNDSDNLPENGEFPWSEVVNCKYLDANDDCQVSSKLEMQLFPECHQLIIDEVENWDFSVSITPLLCDHNGDGIVDPCTSYVSKEWKGTMTTVPDSCPGLKTTPTGSVVSEITPINN